METHSPPFVSVVIPTLNNERLIKGCLFSLLQIDYPAERREILVVDNGSLDGTVEIITGFPVTCLYEERRGVSYARNRGIEASKGHILTFTDPDCVVSRGWLRELVRPFEEETVGGVAGEIVPYPATTPAERYAARRRSHSQERPLKDPSRPFAMISNLAFRREVFERVGLFDTRFIGGGWEDADLCWRFSRGTGWELAYAPRAIVFHRYRTTAGDFFVQHMRYGHGQALLSAKYRGELLWGWRHRLRAYQDLRRATCTLITRGLRHKRGSGGSIDFNTAYFDFLRQLGHRLGFLRAGGIRRRF